MSHDPKGERAFQSDVLDFIVETNGFQRGQDKKIDRELALYTGDLIEFIKHTQPEVYRYFSSYINPEAELAELVARERKVTGTLALVQKGIPESGSRPAIMLYYPKPVSSKNPESQIAFESNIFTIVEEVHYGVKTQTKSEIDLVLFINGIGIAAIELKNELTGQKLEHAELQWKRDRNPSEALLTPNTGCLVYYAVSTGEASFATKLARMQTRFYPFNKGFNYGAGNDPRDADESGCRTYYLWHETWTKTGLNDLIFNYAYLDTDATDNGDITSRRLIFPRYHQLDLISKVRKDLLDADSKYPQGSSFLIQHSAGSGKTKSIVWLANLLSSVHDSEDKALFDSVIIITDRQVVDRQLRDALVEQSRHGDLIGVVDRNSRQLAQYLASGKRIIVSTVQKFSYIKKILEELQASPEGHRYAIIIDEAHSGQTGEHAVQVRERLTGTSNPAKTIKEDSEIPLLDALALSNSLPVSKSLTFFAFTATPRAETIARFCPDGAPYHLYSMKQAIDEEYILNVLDNYVSYEIINQLSFKGEDTKLESTAEAKKALSAYVRKNTETLAYKVETVLNHMATQTVHKIGGEGKGMVVAGSRLEVYEWFKLVQSFIASDPKYAKIKPIAAYTGVLDNLEGKEGSVSDEILNGFPDTNIPDKFDADYNLLIVAQKFQTGFDQPKLCSMYVDRTLTGITAVQTLSRLNRKMPGKEGVCIIDFQQNAGSIRDAFAEYYVKAELDGVRVVTEKDLEATARQVYSYSLFNEENARNYSNALAILRSKGNRQDAVKQAREIILAVGDRIRLLEAEDKVQLDLFKRIAREYLSDYIFLAQFVPIESKTLKDLRVLLIDALQQMSHPASHDDSWLDNIVVSLAGTHIVDEDFTDLTPSPDKDKREPGASTGISLDKPISISELLAGWNARLITGLDIPKTIKVGGLIVKPEYIEIGSDPVKNEVESQEERELKEDCRIVFSAISHDITSNLHISLRRYATGKSFDRFRDPESIKRVSDEIFKSLNRLLRKATNTRTEEPLRYVLSKYSQDDEDSLFRSDLIDFILAAIYQEITNEQLKKYSLL